MKIDLDSRDSPPVRKRQRTDSARSTPGAIPEGLVQSTRRFTLFLEVLERQNPEQHIPIIAPLFGALDRLIAVESDTRTTLNYPKQMVLSSLISIVKGLQVWISVSLLTIEHGAFQFKYLSRRFSDRLHQDLDESSSA